MKHNTCESDITVWKGCKQADRNIASSNSCVALVMIFQEVLTKRLQSSLLSPSQTRKSPHTTGKPCSTRLHVLLFTTHPRHRPNLFPPLLKKIQVIPVLKTAAFPRGLPEHEIDFTSRQTRNSNQETFLLFFVVAHFSSSFVAVI